MRTILAFMAAAALSVATAYGQEAGVGAGPRVQAVEVDVAHVDHVAAGEMNDRVAVGMPARDVNDLGRFAVEMQRDAVVEGHHRERAFRPGRGCAAGAARRTAKS